MMLLKGISLMIGLPRSFALTHESGYEVLGLISFAELLAEAIDDAAGHSLLQLLPLL